MTFDHPRIFRTFLIMVFSQYDIRNKYYCNLNHNAMVFIEEYAFENNVICKMVAILSRSRCVRNSARSRWPFWIMSSGSAFIKPDQLDPWIKDQIRITLLPTISHLLSPNFVSGGRACPSHMTQNLVTVGAKLWTAERFLVDPWFMDYADPVW